MIRTNEQAHAHLADALWWLRGLSAAFRDTGEGEENQAKSLANKLLEVRQWLDRVSDGKVRRIGDEKAVVLTYAEFELLLDAFPTHSDPAPAEVGHARAALRVILSEYQIEAASARNDPDIPF